MQKVDSGAIGWRRVYRPVARAAGLGYGQICLPVEQIANSFRMAASEDAGDMLLVLLLLLPSFMSQLSWAKKE